VSWLDNFLILNIKCFLVALVVNLADSIIINAIFGGRDGRRGHFTKLKALRGVGRFRVRFLLSDMLSALHSPLSTVGYLLSTPSALYSLLPALSSLLSGLCSLLSALCSIFSVLCSLCSKLSPRGSLLSVLSLQRKRYRKRPSKNQCRVGIPY
jgi:hypothetical protein